MFDPGNVAELVDGISQMLGQPQAARDLADAALGLPGQEQQPRPGGAAARQPVSQVLPPLRRPAAPAADLVAESFSTLWPNSIMPLVIASRTWPFAVFKKGTSMHKHMSVLVAAVLIWLSSSFTQSAAATQPASVPPSSPEAAKASSAPCVVSTTPAALANDVDPALGKLTVTFDRPMANGSWSWTGGGDTYPESAGQISYDSSRTTCTMPVKLAPGKVYCVGINSPSNRNFKSAAGVPARRYLILFATRSADGKATAIPRRPRPRGQRHQRSPAAGSDLKGCF